jgi:hypothetical protein
VSTCRYCGLLAASDAAHARARELEPSIATSVPHTWFMQGDHARVTTVKLTEFPYIVSLSLAELGRGAEALQRCASWSPGCPRAGATSWSPRAHCSKATGPRVPRPPGASRRPTSAIPRACSTSRATSRTWARRRRRSRCSSASSPAASASDRRVAERPVAGPAAALEGVGEARKDAESRCARAREAFERLGGERLLGVPGSA